MKTALKIIGIIIGIIIILFIAASIYLSIFFNPNFLKPIISQQVYKYTGRELVFDGDIRWSLLPIPSIDLGKTTLNNLPGFNGRPFIQIKDAKISIRLLPLLHRSIETSKLIVNGFTINLVKNKNNQTNWQTPPRNTTTITPQNTKTQNSTLYPKTTINTSNNLR